MRHLLSTTRFALLALAAMGVFGFTLTSRHPQMPPPTPFDRAQMLAHLAYHVMLPTYLEFEDAAQALQHAMSQLCDAPTMPQLETAQARWRQAASVRKRSEAFQLGLT
jgi:predicted lipoprotein